MSAIAMIVLQCRFRHCNTSHKLGACEKGSVVKKSVFYMQVRVLYILMQNAEKKEERRDRKRS